MHKYLPLFLTLFSLVIGSISANSMQTGRDKEFALVYFKFGPEDLVVKIFPETKGANEALDNTNFVVPKINKGEVNAFVVKRFKNERGFVDYTYKTVFYKINIIDNKKIEIPVYSFKMRFEGDDCIVKYEPLRGVPVSVRQNNYEITYKKDNLTNIIFIKDYDGQDFILTERIRPVIFSGKIRDYKNDTFDFEKDYKKVIRLIKIDSDSTGLSGETAVQTFVDVPLGKEISIGLAPYQIVDISEDERFKLHKLVTKEDEKNEFLIHFAEVWDNIYTQNLIFKDDGYFIDIIFDIGSYDLQYRLGSDEYSFVHKSPLTIPIRKNDGKQLNIKLAAKNYSLNFIEEPVKEMSLNISSMIDAKFHIKELLTRYPVITRERVDGSLEILPNFKKTSFAILSNGRRSIVKYKKIAPLTIYDQDGFIEMGETPIYAQDFNYGKYLFSAEYFQAGDSAFNEPVRIIEEKIVEFSDSKDNKFFEHVKFLKRNDISIPYIEFFSDKSKPNDSDNANLIELTDTKITDSNEANKDLKITDFTADTMTSTTTHINKDSTTDTTTDSTTDTTIDLNIDLTALNSDMTSDSVLIKPDTNESKLDKALTQIEKQLTDQKEKKDEIKQENKTQAKSEDKTNTKTNTKTEQKPEIKSDEKQKRTNELKVDPLDSLKKFKNLKRKDHYNIQINAFEKGVYSITTVLDYRKKYIENYTSLYKKPPAKLPMIIEKKVKGKNYYTIVVGPMKRKEAFSQINAIRKIVFDVFIDFEYKYGAIYYE